MLNCSLIIEFKTKTREIEKQNYNLKKKVHFTLKNVHIICRRVYTA